MPDDDKTVGNGESYLTPKSYTKRATVERTACDVHVPPAADSIIGHCEYYYRPLHCEYMDTVTKVTTASTWAAVKAWAKSWNPWSNKEVATHLLHERQTLTQPECTSSDWSRHSNFMMRHIGCGHKPPSYYLSYGYYYCSEYGAKLFPKLSSDGQAWLVLARHYLQLNMEDGLKQNMQKDTIQMSSVKPGNGSLQMSVPQYQLELDEETFKTFAFKTHPLAYLDGGLAKLGPSDMLKISGGPAMEEWGDSRTWGQVWDSGKVVAGDTVSDAWHKTEDSAQDLANRVLKSLMDTK